MAVQYIVKKNINGWLFTVHSFTGKFLVNIHAANGKPYSQQFLTEQEALNFHSFMCSRFSAFHRKPSKKQLSLFDNH